MHKGKKWLNPMFDIEDNPTPKKLKNCSKQRKSSEEKAKAINYKTETPIINHKNWMKNFEPVKVEDLAVHNKKIQEVEDWLKNAMQNSSDILLLSGPVGCGKTATIQTLANKHGIKITEWITPVDIELPTDYGEYEFKEKQSKKFLDFVINAANFTSLLDNNSNKLVLVEDFPNTFLRTPSEFANVLQQYLNRAKSPIVFICSENNSDNKNTILNIFTPSLKEQFQIHHIVFNSVSTTGLRAALKRTSDIISKKFDSMYNIPTTDLIESVLNTSGGDIRSAILNLHFASLKGINHSLETSVIKEYKGKGKTKKKKTTHKFMSLGKDQTISILHGVGRVLNPKVLSEENGTSKLSHSPEDIVDQFLCNPSSFINFLEENYLPHFSCINDVEKATTALSDADFLLSEWREKFCQEYGLYIAVAGLMLANKSPISAWNPVRGPKNMNPQYPTMQQLPLLNKNFMYKGKILVTDYMTYCKIIGNKIDFEVDNEDYVIE
ncbi:cell cycle checkpoint protein RAD17 [Papilio machaon]|uniref:cell cycle checkpoint protein RAD17 n=1 Tax=Papilio machaon TaxID=76193 RepID=UPI001E665FD6|nr:cell cycle checkpoint protein RAD17 [Papilio machaon]